jgi:hypothetical protein
MVFVFSIPNCRRIVLQFDIIDDPEISERMVSRPTIEKGTQASTTSDRIDVPEGSD